MCLLLKCCHFNGLQTYVGSIRRLSGCDPGAIAVIPAKSLSSPVPESRSRDSGAGRVSYCQCRVWSQRPPWCPACAAVFRDFRGSFFVILYIAQAWPAHGRKTVVVLLVPLRKQNVFDVGFKGGFGGSFHRTASSTNRVRSWRNISNGVITSIPSPSQTVGILIFLLVFAAGFS